MSTETVEQRREELCTLVEKAMESGDFPSAAAVASHAGLYPSALYRVLRKEGSLSKKNTGLLKKALRKYNIHAKIMGLNSSDEGGAQTNGNGHAENSDSKVNGTTTINSAFHAPNFASRILTKVLTIRGNSKSTATCTRIDNMLTRFVEEGLEIVCDSTDTLT